MNLSKLIYSWISFHGITDLFYPLTTWAPIYSLSLTSLWIPINYLNIITLGLSGIHFYTDMYINIFTIYSILIGLIIYGEHKLCQDIILVYMSLIHVPIHLNMLEWTLNTFLLLSMTFIGFYHCNPLMNIMNIIIRTGGRSPNNYLHKMILGFVNAHILTNLLRIKSM
jgi:hypothetical protein